MSKGLTRPYIGGQAVIEGVMMRSPRSFAIVVRRRSGKLAVRERPVRTAVEELGQSGHFSRWPFVRGVTTLIEALRLGTEALRFSSELYEADLEAEERSAKGAAHEVEPQPRPQPRSDTARRVASIAMITFAILLFVALPQAGAGFANRLGGWNLDVRSTLFQALTGAFKLAIVVGYLLLIRAIPEIRRVFQYHGAEHKTISTYEAGEPLVVENARTKSTLHPRCGTTFIVMVALVSIFVFAVAAPLLPHFAVGKVLEHLLLFALKLPALPVIIAVTFELQRLSARYCTRGPLRALLWPGFLVQKITTIEPDDAQLEVALASLRVTLWREQSLERAPAGTVERTFDSFDAVAKDPGYLPAA
jgi:uncharacterized protein YqhQ